MDYYYLIQNLFIRISIPELTEEMCERISTALSGGRTPTSPVAEFERNQCTATDLRTLNGLNWLNDEVFIFIKYMLICSKNWIST